MKALFIDRDGTINYDCPYCKDPKDLRIYDDAVKLMKEYQNKGYLIVIITNQSGINRGYFSDSEFHAFNDAVIKALAERGVTVNATYYCPHRPDEGCECRKPKPGLVLRAVEELGIDLADSIIAGDRQDRDGDLARNLGIPFIHFKR